MTVHSLNIEILRNHTEEARAKLRAEHEAQKMAEWFDICDLINNEALSGRDYIIFPNPLHAENFDRLRELGFNIRSSWPMGDKTIISWEERGQTP